MFVREKKVSGNLGGDVNALDDGQAEKEREDSGGAPRRSFRDDEVFH